MLGNGADLERELERLERVYGGFTKSPRRGHSGSKYDPRQEGTRFERGGDRMAKEHHHYSSVYAECLLNRLTTPQVIVEVGILTGIGLATWAEILAPGSRIIGLDIAPSYFEQNRGNLEVRGAFKKNKPEVYRFEQYEDNTNYVRQLLGGDKIMIAIDDGCHTDAAIIATMKSLLPHMAKDFIYFIEDNEEVHKIIRAEFPALDVEPIRTGNNYKDSVLTFVKLKQEYQK